jgi:hypothetical protein
VTICDEPGRHRPPLGGRRRSDACRGVEVAATWHLVRSPRWGEEVDAEADRSERLDDVLDVRWDALRVSHLHDDVDRRCRLGDEAQTALIDSESTPRAARHAVSSAQRVRHGVLVPGRRRPDDHEPCGDLAAITQGTGHGRADALLARHVVDDPRGGPQRGTVPDVSTVVALQRGDPITDVVTLEARDPSLHGSRAYGTVRCGGIDVVSRSSPA